MGFDWWKCCNTPKGVGHSSLQITQNYINLLVSDMTKDIEEFNILREFKRESLKMNK